MGSIDLSSEGQKVFIGKFIAAFSGFIGIIIYANILGATGLGLYYIAHAVASLASKPGDGIGIAIERINSSVEDKKDKYNSVGVIIITIYILFISLISIFLYQNSYTLRVNTPPYSIVYLTILLFILFCIYRLLGRIYSGLGEPGDSVMIDAWRGILETIIQVSLLVLGFGVNGLIAGTIISMIVSILYLLIFTSISFSKPKKEFIYPIINFAKWSIISVSIKDMYIRFDTLLIGFIVSPAAVGIYESTMRIVKPSKYVGYSIERPLLIRVSQERAKNNSVKHFVNNITPYASSLAIPLLFGAIFISEELLNFLYGSEFIAGAPILVGGAIYYTIYTHSNVLSEFIHGYNKPSFVTKSIVIGMAIRIICSVIFLSEIGLLGIIPSIIISETVRFIVLRYLIKQICNISYNPYKIKTQFQSAIIMSIVILPFYISFDTSHYLTLTWIISIGGLSYIISLIHIDNNVKQIISKKPIIKYFIFISNN